MGSSLPPAPPSAAAGAPGEPAGSGTGAVGAAASVSVTRVSTTGGAAAPAPDLVAVEAALELRLAGKAFTVLMRTPGHDEELVRGFLFSEGVAPGRDDIVRVAEPAGLPAHERGHVLDVDLVPGLEGLARERGTYSSSACGTCGRRSLDSLHLAQGRLDDPLRVPRALLAQLPERLRSAQPGFGATGGSHACGLFSAQGDLLVLREDVGRHNAVDKVLGWALAQGRVPLAGCVMVLSGRIAFELVEKAVLAGVPVLAAVGAPTSLAVEVALQHGLTLAGFVRPGGLNLYAGAQRVV